MFYLINNGGVGYIDYSDKDVYTYNEATYSRARDLDRGYGRAVLALRFRNYELSTYLDNEGYYRYQIKTKGGLVLRSKKQYNSIKKAEDASRKWSCSRKVKRVTY